MINEIMTLNIASSALDSQGRRADWIERAAGVCFIGIGGKILADARNPVTP